MVTRPDTLPIPKNIKKKDDRQAMATVAGLGGGALAFGGHWFLAIILGLISMSLFDSASKIKTHKKWVGSVDQYR